MNYIAEYSPIEDLNIQRINLEKKKIIKMVRKINKDKNIKKKINRNIKNISYTNVEKNNKKY